ncbi:MFS family permease [Prauserella sediminis]|uniref:MFS family permease n=1 Tax=Prauserella sediminis TaxID=577680 RepID=A0A839XMF4_9PSEU|nr:MFS transporter [Prauserella sediminis]MBB3661938.1 MFS family permease [Prauserella sediminis]
MRAAAGRAASGVAASGVAVPREAPASRAGSPGAFVPWAMWALGALCYLTAMFHRMSLSVAGLTAQERFDIDATGLAAFSVVQLTLYALLQVPVGIGNDRYGPRALLLGGTALMAAGSVVFALATAYPAAMAGRALIGAGDACMFVSVLRITRNWFPGHRYAFVSALTGMIGGLGQIIATSPLASLLDAEGWTGAFLIASVVTVVVLTATAVALRESPQPRVVPDTAAPAGGSPGSAAPEGTAAPASERLRDTLRLTWRSPGVRHALLTHFVLMGSFVSFTAVLGQPYLVAVHGLSGGAAAGLVMAVVLGFVVSSTAAGRLASHRPHVRGRLVLGAGALAVAGAVALVALPAGATAATLLPPLIALGVGGGVSMLAFDLARSASPEHRAGVASGLANMGGFTFAVVSQLGAGLAIDGLLAAGAGQAAAHRYAFAIPLAMAAVGVVGMVRLRRFAGAAGTDTPAVREPDPDLVPLPLGGVAAAPVERRHDQKVNAPAGENRTV